MTTQVQAAPRTGPFSLGRQPWLAALAIIPVLLTVYQTLVLTDVTDDVIRKGIEFEKYDNVWVSVCWGIAVLYGLFGAVWMAPRYGARASVGVGLILFALGNLLCGAAFNLASLSAAKVVEGLGKGMTIALCRAMLYRQFDRAIMIAIAIYGVIAYATRPVTPLVTAVINDSLSWRWIFWVNVPGALIGFVLIRRCVLPDRPAKPFPLRLDWFAVTLFAAWVVCMEFTFSWYRRWGGWTSNWFALTAVLSMLLPIALGVWVGGGLSPDEHLRRMFRTRKYVLAMCVRMLLLVLLAAVVGVMGTYLVELRDYPRATAGWVLAAVAPPMAAATLLTVWFNRRPLRHVWLLIGILGSAGCLWWLASMQLLFVAKGHIAAILACWGFFVGLLPPVFLADEVEALDPRDRMYGSALAVLFLVVPLLIIPTVMSTVISAWTDRALDAQRVNLEPGRPAVEEAGGHLAEYYRQRGVEGAESAQMAATVLGTSVHLQSAAHGIQSGLRYLSLITGAIGILLTLLLFIPTAAQKPG